MDCVLFTPNGSGLIPPSLPGPIARVAGAALGLTRIRALYQELRRTTPERPLVERLLQNLEIQIQVSQKDLDHIPRAGPVLVVVNHPSGILDGAVLAKLLFSLRRDVKILANHLLTAISEIRDVLIPADVLSGKPAVRANLSSIRKSVRVLVDGGLLAAFPAGEVSRFAGAGRWLRIPHGIPPQRPSYGWRSTAGRRFPWSRSISRSRIACFSMRQGCSAPGFRPCCWAGNS